MHYRTQLCLHRFLASTCQPANEAFMINGVRITTTNGAFALISIFLSSLLCSGYTCSTACFRAWKAMFVLAWYHDMYKLLLYIGMLDDCWYYFYRSKLCRDMRSRRWTRGQYGLLIQSIAKTYPSQLVIDLMEVRGLELSLPDFLIRVHLKIFMWGWERWHLEPNQERNVRNQSNWPSTVFLNRTRLLTT